ncbi:MYO3 [Mytilus coruscus]|uniref:MYO3 n=1 Tax=Mytilus coruscus TaxID=42192 RepID=A0A6J8AEB0_MYTCO|nr:MYO3 [Mytilus coruscus]
MKKKAKGEPHFIRCIKPNSNQLPHLFDDKIVLSQLISTGVLETTRIRKLGYPTRMSFEDFIHRDNFENDFANDGVHLNNCKIGYMIAFLRQVDENEIGPRVCKHILKDAGLKDCEIGQSRVFLKYFHTEQLNLCLDNIYEGIITVQKCVRGSFARKFCQRLKQIQHQQNRDLAEFSISLNRDCDRVYHMMLSSNDHDHHKFQKLVENRRFRRPYRHRSEEIEDFPDYEEPSFRSPEPDYYNQSSRGLNRESMSPRGLSRENVYYPVIQQDKEYLYQGIILRKEEEGGILARRIGKISCIVKDFKQPHDYCFSEEVIEKEGKIPIDEFLKIFDVNQLHSHMGLALEATKTSSDTRSLLYREPVLKLRTIVGISLLEDDEDISQTPLWLLVISLEALRALDDQDGLYIK